MNSLKTDSFIAIVGAGQGGTAILKVLLEIPGVRVKYICDKDPSAEGLRLAGKADIKCLDQFKNSPIITDSSLDLIIEATGNEEVARYLKEYTEKSVTVIDSNTARIIYYLLDGQQKITRELQQCKLFLSEKVLERTEELENSNRELQRRINEYHELNSRLQKINDEKTRYLVNATHQLKAPFAAIQSYTELLLEGYADKLSDKALTIVEKMKNRCMLLTQSIKEMLELANLNSFVEDNLVKKPENLAEIVKNCIDTLSPVRKSKGISIKLNTQKEHLIKCSKKQIESLVQILLENALNYSYRNSSVTIDIFNEDNGRTILSVRDEGIGIEEKNLDNIFKEYFRTNRAVKQSYNGSGLGLAIAKRIVELHRGTITVDSKAGEGSVFKVEFSL